MKKVLLAGATGYLGGYIAKELIKQNYQVKIIARNIQKLDSEIVNHDNVKIIKAEVTNPESLANCCEEVDTDISTVGITRQKDGLTYMDVDYQANANLLQEAKKAGVRKFIFVSVFKGDTLKYLKILEAKEKFVSELNASGMEFTIIRPTGFFSDMADFLNMAKKGKVELFGNGQLRMNPIHGADLAEVCVSAIETDKTEINVGGPDVLTQNEIATIALSAWGKEIKIAHLPDWIRKLTIWSVRTFTSSKTYGPIEFFLTVMAFDVVAPTYGKYKLEDFFKERVAKGN